MPRLVYLAGLAFLLVAGAFLLTDALLWAPGVTEANLSRIQPGMTRRQVEARFGRPGGPIKFDPLNREKKREMLGWINPEGLAWVVFDHLDRVVGAGFFPHDSPEYPLFVHYYLRR